MSQSREESPLERVERQLADYKAREAVNAERAGYPIPPGAWPLGYNEALKLRVVEGELDWTGVAAQAKEAILAREVDFTGITREQLNYVYEDIGFDHERKVDERPARRLFDEANYAKAKAMAGRMPFGAQMKQVRPTTRNLIEAVALDTWPRPAAVVDFGIDSQEHYEALRDPINNGEIAPIVLDAAMGHGQNLTELVRDAPSNPHKDVVFRTSWDEIFMRPGSSSEPIADESVGPLPGRAHGPESAADQERCVGLQSGHAEERGARHSEPQAVHAEGTRRHPWPSEIAHANRQKPTGQEQGKGGGHENSNGRDDGHSL